MAKPSNHQSDFLERIHEHQGIVHRVCSVYASTPEDHEDLYQEILMQGWRSYGSFRGGAKFSTWLYRVALNTALLRRRSASRRPELTPVNTDEDLSASDDPGPDADVAALRQCIRRLPTLDRAIVLLHLEQHNQREIAEIVGLSRPAIGARLGRIKQQLEQWLVGQRQCRREG